MNNNTDIFDVVVIGGGVAAGACVTTLREQGFTGSIALACAEPHPPYTRPGLTKQVLRGEKPESAALWKPADWYTDNNVELLTSSAATDLDTRSRRVRVAGRTLSYNNLVLATGADPRTLDLGDDVRDRMHVIRSFADAHRVRPHLGEGHRWLVIGGGFIGSEFAASACLTGSTVDLVMLEEQILEGPFGTAAATWFDSRLRAQGVTVHAKASVASITRGGDDLQVLLSDDTRITVDQICVGIGVVPNTGLAQQAGIKLAHGGIATDASLRTSAPNVFAIGDVSAFDSTLHGECVRIEHWAVARDHGVHVATQIASGECTDFSNMPYFFGTMADWAFLEYVGTATSNGIARGACEGDDMSIAYLDDDDVLVGLLMVKRPDDLAAARELIPQHVRMNPADLANAECELGACRQPQEMKS